MTHAQFSVHMLSTIVFWIVAHCGLTCKACGFVESGPYHFYCTSDNAKFKLHSRIEKPIKPDMLRLDLFFRLRWVAYTGKYNHKIKQVYTFSFPKASILYTFSGY